MIRGRVLVIDGDEWLGRGLARVLEEKGFKADVCLGAQDGYHKAIELGPDCIVCNPDLPDIDGAYVARRVRTESGAVSKTPILFVGEVTEPGVRTQALAVGADVFLARPLSNDEILGQVGALIAMRQRYEDDGPASSATTTAAIRGDLSAFPLASLLMMFEMERRSGTIQIVAQSGKRAIITMSGGLFASTEVGGQQRPALEVLREVLSWRAGRFSFAATESANLPAPRASIGALVLEAMRLEDEAKEGMQELDGSDLVESPMSVVPRRRSPI